MRSAGSKIAFLSLCTTLGLILSYIEAIIPVFFGVPGMKPGFSNILVVFLIYRYGVKEALMVNLLRIILSGLLFGNPYSIAYSLAGGLLSLLGMVLIKRSSLFSVYGVSMAGGMLHNIAQVTVAVFLVSNYKVYLYLPVLLITGCITGFIVGLMAAVMVKRVPRGQGETI